MFEFTGGATTDSQRDENNPDWMVMDHHSTQKLGTRPLTTRLDPTAPSPHHQRALTKSIPNRRPSLNLRSRSNSSMPNSTPFNNNLSPVATIDQSTPRSSTSQDRYSYNGLSSKGRRERSESFGKSWIAKGSRLLSRHNSKNDLTALYPMDRPEGNGRHVQEMSNRPGSRHSRVRSSGEDGIAQWNISEPFNFEHIMHTTPQKVKEIDELSHSDLIAEFSSLRCSQLGTRSRELKGIKTTEIHRETFLPQAIVSGNSSPSLPPLKHRVSPPISPRRRKWQEEDARYDTPVITVPSPSRSLRSAASVENFSQPSPRLYKAPFAPRSPPPRSSSRNAAPDFFTSYQELPTDAAFEPDVHASLEPSTCLNETWEADAYDLEQPHAVTTPDDTAHSLQSPPYTIVRTELAGVPEEDEISLSEGKRISTDTLILRTPTPTSALRHAKSFPSTHASSPRPHRWSGALPQTPEVDDAAIAKQSSAVNTHTIARFSSEEHVDEVPVRPRFSKHLSMKREESWEDIIDYCYEHEAEANCDFDWDRVSLHGKLPEVPAPSVSNDAKSSPEISTLHDRSSVTSIPKHSIRSRSSSAYSASPPLLLPLQTFLPELDDPSANSAVSSFNSISEAVTPLDPSGTTAVTQTSVTDFRDNWSDAADPSYPGVVGNVGNEHDSFILQEDLYHQIITGELLPKQHPFPFSVGHVDGSTIDESPRSSRSPISKSSSQESFWYAKAAKRQRNTGSIDSLPDLMGGKTRLDAGTEQFGEHSGILNPTESASDAAPMRRHNIPNLAKDVALKSILAKAMTSEEHLNAAELPLHPALRDRAGSDAAFGLGDIGTIPPPPVGEVNLARRVRSTSSASSMSQRASRASYSLFPQSINRQA